MHCVLRSNFMRETMPRNPKRKTMVFGVGINDADYVVDPSKKSGLKKCPAYHSWARMMQRVYSDAFAKKNPTYHDVTICEEWHIFSNFRSWWVDHAVDNWELDKDLLILGNKEYSPDKCIYIPKWLNVIANGADAARGDLPIGVTYNKKSGMYYAQISIGGPSQKHLGSFNSPSEAHSAWICAKIDYINSKRSEIDGIDKRIYQNIMCIVNSK